MNLIVNKNITKQNIPKVFKFLKNFISSPVIKFLVDPIFFY